jgi:hypothetical protein
MKSRRMRWAGDVARMAEKRNAIYIVLLHGFETRIFELHTGTLIHIGCNV